MAVPDLSLIAVFVKVVELESFTAAAKALGLPKSSVSRSVAQLEEALGVRLLQRTSRKSSLTDEGRAFVERVREPLAGVLEAMSDAAESQREPRGLIRLTAAPDLGSALLAAPIAEFARKHPLIRVELTLTTRIVDLVAERFDLAIRATPRLEDSSLVARKTSGSEGGLFASPEYIKRRGKPRSVAELSEHECVVFRGHEGHTTWRLLGPNGPEQIEVRGGDLVRVLPDYTPEAGSLFVVMPSGRHVPARVVLLRDFLHEKLRLSVRFDGSAAAHEPVAA